LEGFMEGLECLWICKVIINNHCYFF
jgi:hypothetical protein